MREKNDCLIQYMLLGEYLRDCNEIVCCHYDGFLVHLIVF